MNFKKITLRKQITSRGGGIEIDLSSMGYEGVRMTAYQNYLGGGMLGKVANDCSLLTKVWKADPKLVEIAEELRKYFFGLTNPPSDEWESVSYEQNQSMAVSGY